MATLICNSNNNFVVYFFYAHVRCILEHLRGSGIRSIHSLGSHSVEFSIKAFLSNDSVENPRITSGEGVRSHIISLKEWWVFIKPACSTYLGRHMAVLARSNGLVVGQTATKTAIFEDYARSSKVTVKPLAVCPLLRGGIQNVCGWPFDTNLI